MKRVLWTHQIIFTTILLFLATDCKKEEIPVLSTTQVQVTDVTSSTATFEINITSDGGSTITACGICWSTTANPTINNDSKTVDGSGIGLFSISIDGLTGGTVYHVREFATNYVGTAYGKDTTFTTLGEAPTCSTQSATNIFATGATLNGTVSANYVSATVTFEYGTTTSYGSTVTASQSPVTGDTTHTNVSADIAGLTGGATYYFRVKAENSLGVDYGLGLEFFTTQVPTVSTFGVTNLTSTAATLYGTINANSFSSVVTIEYGTTTSYGQEVTPEQSPLTGNTNTDIVVTLTGLTCGTTYHFRVKAENSIGTSYSDDKTFSLAQIPALITNSVSGITATTAVSGGNIISDGCASITARGVEWSTRTPPWTPTCFHCAMIHKTVDGAGTGSFTSNLIGLSPNTTYYVRAYATNSAGTGHGDMISFKTLP